MIKSVIVLNLIVVILFSCQQHQEHQSPVDKNIAVPQRPQPTTITYQSENAKKWLVQHSTDTTAQKIAFAVNRTDSSNFAKMDSVIIPTDLSGDIVYYLPFPLNVPYLKDINKIIFFSYRTQTFATYEKGNLIYTGPTNMGRKKDPTPTGLFYTNWKAEETTSTFNDEWNLRWNFNIINKEGIGWHQYSLPGYPASHSCLRLQEKDARYLYDWADEWVLIGKDSVRIKGTPVIVFGVYDFSAPKPWLKLISDPHAIDISAEEIQKETTPFLNEILAEQKKREAYQVSNNKK